MAGLGIDGIDHLVIAVRDLERAREGYARLGFTLTPKGRHTALKSANHTIMFGCGDYLELMGFEEPHPVTAPFAALLERREGLTAVAFRSEDARDAQARLAASGIAATVPVDFGRPVALPEGEREARFTLTHLPAGTLPAGHGFVVQHHTRELVWRPEYEAHANGATGIAALAVAAEDVDATAARFAALLGSGVEHRGLARVVPGGSSAVLVAPPSLLRWAWTDDPLLAAAQAGEPLPFLAGVVLRVGHFDTAQRVLQTSKLPVIGNSAILRVRSPNAHGCMLAFGVEPDLTALVP